jgi:hypothetical protein
MDSNRLKEVIRRGAEELKKPAKEGQTHSRQTADAHKERRAKVAKLINSSYEMVANYLFQEGYANSFENALVVADVISDEWFGDILEATSATRATVRGRGRQPGSAQRAIAREDRRREAEERAAETRRKLEADREYAATRRANPNILKTEAQKRTLSTRMERAAQRLGLQ